MVDLSGKFNQILSFKDGSQANFWQLYDINHSLVHQYIHDQCKDAEISRQVLDYAFARAWACRDLFEDEDWFVFFLYSEAVFRLKELRELAKLEFMRRVVRVGAREMDAEADWSVLIGKVGAAIDRLSKRRRMAIVEHYIKGKPVNQIAEEYSLSPQTVWNHLLRGMKKLRKDLKGIRRF